MLDMHFAFNKQKVTISPTIKTILKVTNYPFKVNPFIKFPAAKRNRVGRAFEKSEKADTIETLFSSPLVHLFTYSLIHLIENNTFLWFIYYIVFYFPFSIKNSSYVNMLELRL